MNLVPEVTPHTYQVREISFVEWVAAMAAYLTKKKAEAK